MRVTRRKLLAGVLAAPPGITAAARNRPHIVVEDGNLLAAESAEGYRALLTRHPGTAACSQVVTCVVNLSRSAALALREEAEAGCWPVLESGLGFASRYSIVRQRAILRETFGLLLDDSVPVPPHSYVHYRWPVHEAVPNFSRVVPARGPHVQPIAAIGGVVAAARIRCGSGGLIFLGSPLGPALRAGDREAHRVASGLLV